MAADRVITRDFSLAWLASFFEGLSWSLFIHLAGFLALLGASETQIGWIFGVSAAAAVAIRPIIGRAMDTYGRMPVIHVGNVLNVVAVLLYFTVTTIGPWVYFVRILQALALATLFSALFTYGADVVPESRRTEGFALFGVSGLLPLAVAGILGDIILDVAGYDQLFMLAAACAVAALVLSLPLPERKPDHIEGEGPRGFLSVVRSGRLRPIWFLVGGFAFVLTAYFVFLRTYVDETGIGSVGVFFGAYAATAVLLRIFLGWLPERIGRKRVLFPALAAFAAGLLLLAGAGSTAVFAVAGVLCGAGHGFGFPILSSYVVERATVSDRGSSMSFFTALFDLGQLAAGPILGLLIAGLGYSAMFAFSAALITVVTIIFAIWDRGADAAHAVPQTPVAT